MRIEPWEIAGSQGEVILGNAHLPAVDPTGVLLICHGFKGYKDYGLMPRLADAAAHMGWVAHRFNFSHSGMTRRLERFERPDLFERDTWGKQVSDLRTVSQAVRAGQLPDVDAAVGAQSPQVWFGHSRGGVTVLLAAAEALADGTGRPAGLVTAAAPADACSLDAAQRAMLRQDGYLVSPSSRTGQPLRVGQAWLDEIEAEPERFDPVQAAQLLGKAGMPLLIVHGSADDTVPSDAARRLGEAAGKAAQVEIIHGASHTFDAPNPLPAGTDLPAATAKLIELTLAHARGCAG